MKRALLVNKFVPPDTPPTAKLLADIADGLRAEGWDVEFLGRSEGYRAQPKNRILRLFDELSFHLRVIAFTIGRRKRVDVVLTLTSPPALVFSGGLLAGIAGARHYHWCMDLYPDVAVALGALSPRGLPFRIVKRLMDGSYRNCTRIVALDEDMAEKFRNRGFECDVLAPWPPEYSIPTELPEKKGEAPFWLYTGNLGRAHEWRTLLEAQRLLEQAGSPLRLVFQGSGPEWSEAQRLAEKLGLRSCEWRGFAPEDELISQIHRATALVVTQRPETAGFLHPSKMSVFAATDTPVVWVGNPDSNVANRVPKSRLCSVAPGESNQIAAFLENLPSRAISSASFQSFKESVRAARASGISRWNDWFEENSH